ncbi:hypothetical protein BJX64DRAFT_258522 [Aspergillus heterothallicus]
MRSTAKLALGFLAVPLSSLVAGASQISGDRTSVSSNYETNEYTIVRFEAQCSGCQATQYSSLPLEVKIHKNHAACDATGIYLNGDHLIHDWSGESGHGFGSISSLAGDARSSFSARWESFCAPVSCDDSESCVSQIMTVQLEQAGEEGFGSDIRFSITLSGDRNLEIKSLCNHPWHIFWPSLMEDEEDVKNCPECNPWTSQAEESLEALYDRLGILQFEANELQRQIQGLERKIRKRLTAGCPRSGNTTTWETCTILPCKFKHLFSLIPGFLRQIRYRFGPLPYSTPESICAHDPVIEITRTVNTTTSAIGLLRTSPSSDKIDAADNNLYLITLPALLILSLVLAAPILITLLIYHKSTCCLRRRADRAARREERRARAAYKSAARRLRWRQWLQSWGLPLFSGLPDTTSYTQIHEFSPAPGVTEAPGEARARCPYSQVFLDTDDELVAGANILDTEIWNFRQVLDYVGDLIRVPTSTREIDLESGYPLSGADTENSGQRDPSRVTLRRRSRAASSTAGLSTVVSLRTMTMSIPDTDTDVEIEETLSESCVTLNTLHSETPPPSYHP